MIRFLMVKKEKLTAGVERVVCYTIDEESPELEKALTAGGSTATEYEVHQLLGVEVLGDE